MSHDFAFPARVTADETGMFRARFPDFPEALATGRSRADALAAAADSLTEALAARIEAREPIPLPSRLSDEFMMVSPDPRIIDEAIEHCGALV